MTPTTLQGSATILPFTPRRAGASAARIRPAEVTRLRPAPRALAAMCVVDVDGWYHAEAMQDAQSVGRH